MKIPRDVFHQTGGLPLPRGTPTFLGEPVILPLSSSNVLYHLQFLFHAKLIRTRQLVTLNLSSPLKSFVASFSFSFLFFILLIFYSFGVLILLVHLTGCEACSDDLIKLKLFSATRKHLVFVHAKEVISVNALKPT